jgi:hypothetical protein
MSFLPTQIFCSNISLNILHLQETNNIYEAVIAQKCSFFKEKYSSEIIIAIKELL